MGEVEGDVKALRLVQVIMQGVGYNVDMYVQLKF